MVERRPYNPDKRQISAQWRFNSSQRHQQVYAPVPGMDTVRISTPLYAGSNPVGGAKIEESMKKVTSLVKNPTQKQLESLLTDKQRVFVNNLRAEGATFTLVPRGTYVHVNVISRLPSYRMYENMDPDINVDDGDLTFGETQDLGFWGF